MKGNTSIFERQSKRQQEMADALAKEKGTLNQPKVFINPYGIAPLSALVCFESEEEERFQLILSDAKGREFLRYDVESAYQHLLPVIALIAGGTTMVKGIGKSGEIFELTIEAAAIEALPEVQQNTNALDNSLIALLPADGTTQTVMVNKWGEICWTCTRPLNHKLHMLDNGHFLVGTPIQLAPPYSGTSLWEMDATGFVYKEYRFEEGFIGDFVVVNDQIVCISHTQGQGTVRDKLLWIDCNTGETTAQLAASDYLPPFNGTAGQSGSDWFSGISLRYDKKHQMLYWTGLAQNVVLEIDATTRNVTQIIGCVEGWDEKRTRLDLFRNVPKDTFEDIYSATRVDDALIYINAHRYPNGKRGEAKPVSIHQLDMNTGVVSEFLSMHESLISPVFNDVQINDDDSVLVLAGGGSNSNIGVPALFALEKQPDVELWADILLYRHSEDTLQYHVDTNIIAATIIHPEHIQHTAQADGVLGAWRNHYEVDIELPVLDEENDMGDSDVVFWHDDARLYVSGTFYKGEACVLILKNETEKHQFFLVTNRKPSGTEWLYTYVDGIERKLNWGIPVGHLKGQWQIDLLVDDCLIHTGETLELL